MFEEEILLGNTERSIALETRKGRPIANALELDPPPEHATRRYRLLRSEYGQAWTHRKDACGFYNCYGMVFASRRTSIFEDAQIPAILQDDGYRRLADRRHLMPGDLVFYRDQRSRMLLHVSVVTRCEASDLAPAVFVLSKWDSTSGEDEHNILEHCWVRAREFDLVIECWTDR